MIGQMRRLGKTTLESWASGAETTLGAQLKQKDASAVVRKKNGEVVAVQRFFMLQSASTVKVENVVSKLQSGKATGCLVALR